MSEIFNFAHLQWETKLTILHAVKNQREDFGKWSNLLICIMSKKKRGKFIMKKEDNILRRSGREFC